MRYLHTMVRVRDIEDSKRFYCDGLGLRETRRYENEGGRFTLVFLAAPGDEQAQIELTYNWDPEDYQGGRNFGHLAYETADIYALCQHLSDMGYTINRPAGRSHGLRPLTGRDLCGAVAGRRGAGPGRALGQHGKHRLLVGAANLP